MALTIGKSPLAGPPGGKFNFEIERLPRHILYLEDFQKRIRGQLAGETVVDSRRGKLLHETGKFPQWYVPKEDVEPKALEPSERRQEHPFRGVATYYPSVRGTGAHWMPRGATSNRPKSSRWPAWSPLSSISSTDGWKRTTRFVDTRGTPITASTVTIPRR
jgi:Domain of unknown function (DUF427)